VAKKGDSALIPPIFSPMNDLVILLTTVQVQKSRLFRAFFESEIASIIAYFTAGGSWYGLTAR
jgi:hypothetical protein